MDDHSDTLHRFSRTLAEVSDLPTLRERLSEAARRTIDADGVTVATDTVPDGLTTLYCAPQRAWVLDRLQHRIGEGPTTDALHSGEVVLSEFDGTDDTRWPALRDELSEVRFTGAIIAVPLRSELDLRGVLTAHRVDGPRRSDRDDARFLAGAIGTAVLQDPEVGAQGHVFSEVIADRDAVQAASGRLADRHVLRREDALALLRAIAFTRGERLGQAARRLLDEGIDDLVSPAPGRD